MARGIIDLIKENKTRFYRGEIRNFYFDDPAKLKAQTNQAAIIDNSSENQSEISYWESLVTFGKKFRNELFYEGVK